MDYKVDRARQKLDEALDALKEAADSMNEVAGDKEGEWKDEYIDEFRKTAVDLYAMRNSIYTIKRKL